MVEFRQLPVDTLHGSVLHLRDSKVVYIEVLAALVL